MKQKKVFVVLGVPRSGTSVISRGIKALGIDLGNMLTPANSEWNPKGFWEDNEIVYKVNARVLAALDRPWESLRWFDAVSTTDGKLHDIKQFAAKLLEQRFSLTEYWSFKDPNTAKILPFWQSVFEMLSVEDHYIIAFRNPLSSAQSYHKLTDIDIEHGLLMWLIHMMAAVDGTQGKKRVLVSYDLLMKNPRLQLDRMKNNLAIPFTSDDAEINRYVNCFLDKKLHHYENSMEDLQHHPAIAVAPLCLKIYDLLSKIATDQITFEDNDFVSNWRNIKDNVDTILPIYLYIDTLLQKNRLLRKSIRSLHKSRLWKIITPLRKIDDALRARRKRLHVKKSCIANQ